MDDAGDLVAAAFARLGSHPIATTPSLTNHAELVLERRASVEALVQELEHDDLTVDHDAAVRAAQKAVVREHNELRARGRIEQLLDRLEAIEVGTPEAAAAADLAGAAAFEYAASLHLFASHLRLLATVTQHVEVASPRAHAHVA